MSNAAKHTPRPIQDGLDGPIIGWRVGDAKFTSESDARLFAAAPDLLAALRARLDGPRFTDSHSPYYTFNEDQYEAARRAIARAEGRDA